jgi:hypothetical protein
MWAECGGECSPAHLERVAVTWLFGTTIRFSAEVVRKLKFPNNSNEQKRKRGRFIRIDQKEIPEGKPTPGYLKDLKFSVILYKQAPPPENLKFWGNKLRLSRNSSHFPKGWEPQINII